MTSENRVITGGFNIFSNFQGRFGDGTLNSRTYAVDITENFNLSSGETVDGLFLDDTYYIGAYTSFGRIFTWGICGAGTGVLFGEPYVNLPFDITPFFNLADGEVFVSYGKRMITSFNRVFEIVGPYVAYQENYVNLPIEIASDIKLQEGELFFQAIETDILTTSFGRVIVYNYFNNLDISTLTLFEKGEEIQSYLVQYDKLKYFFTTKNQLFQYIEGEGKWKKINHLFNLNENEYLVSFYGNDTNCYVITSDNRLFSWGKNNGGSIGNGEYIDQDSPIEITMYFDLLDGEIIENIIVPNNIFPIQAITSEDRIFAWGYYTPYVSLNNTPRPISYLVSDVVLTIELEEGEIINPEILLSNYIIEGYFNDINCYHPFDTEVMPPSNLVVYLKLEQSAE